MKTRTGKARVTKNKNSVVTCFLIVLLLFLTGLTTVNAQFQLTDKHSVIKSEKDKPFISSGCNKLRIIRDLNYSSDDVDELKKLDVYTSACAANWPIIIYVHGGAWQFGDKSNTSYKPTASIAAGYVFVSVNYRLVPQVEVSDQLDDIAQAVANIKINADVFGGNPNQLILMGHSAGAHLVSMLGTHSETLAAYGVSNSDLSSVIALDTKAFDLSLLAALNEGQLPVVYESVFGNDLENWDRYSPVSYISDDLNAQSFILVSSGGSAERAQRRRDVVDTFYRQLIDQGIKTTFLPVTEKDHAQINRELGADDDWVFEYILKAL